MIKTDADDLKAAGRCQLSEGKALGDKEEGFGLRWEKVRLRYLREFDANFVQFIYIKNV